MNKIQYKWKILFPYEERVGWRTGWWFSWKSCWSWNLHDQKELPPGRNETDSLYIIYIYTHSHTLTHTFSVFIPAKQHPLFRHGCRQFINTEYKTHFHALPHNPNSLTAPIKLRASHHHLQINARYIMDGRLTLAIIYRSSGVR